MYRVYITGGTDFKNVPPPQWMIRKKGWWRERMGKREGEDGEEEVM